MSVGMIDCLVSGKTLTNGYEDSSLIAQRRAWVRVEDIPLEIHHTCETAIVGGVSS